MKHTKHNRAFMLLELIAVIACLSIILVVAMTLLVQMFNMQKRSRDISDWTRSTNRFVDIFRDDVHRFGKPVILNNEEALLRWQFEDSVIEYQLGSEAHVGKIVRRIETTAGKITRKEEYRLQKDMELFFVEGAKKHEGMIALSLWISPGERHLSEVKMEDLNPFDRTWVAQGVGQETPPPGIWRTVQVRAQN